MNKVEEFISFLISSTLSGDLYWVEVSKDEHYIPDPVFPDLICVRLLGMSEIEIFKNGTKIYIEPGIIRDNKEKLIELYWTIKKDKYKKILISGLTCSLYNPLCNLLYILMWGAEKREREEELGDIIDSLILLLGR